MSEPAAIGIDLGTNYFRVGIYRGGRFEIICNEEHKRKTPCYVALIGDKWVTGDVAKHRAHEDIENTIYSSKRMIGRPYGDLEKLMEYNHWHFAIRGFNDITQIKVKGRKRAIFPIEISARILHTAREMAESHLQREVEKAVLTVPECFTKQQKEATLLAGTLAGLKVLDIITDPMAAAISYAHASEVVGNGKSACILVLSVGGGFYDVSTVSLKDDKITTLYTTGSADLGGQDIDAALFEYFSTKIKARYNRGKGQMFLFLQECIAAKESLAQCESITFSADKLDEDVLFKMKTENFKTIGKLKYFISKINSSVTSALAHAKTKGYTIDEIVQIGGSTRIKSIQECLLQANLPIRHFLDVDEAVVQGAAYHAYTLCSDGRRVLVKRSLPIYDVAPAPNEHSFGPDQKNIERIRSEIEEERERMKEIKRKEKELYDFECFINRTQKELRKTGCQEQDISKSCASYLQWIADNRSSVVSIEEIRRNYEEFCASVQKKKNMVSMMK